MPISLAASPRIWASDTNFSSGPDTGSPTRVDPGSGYFAQGWVPGQTIPGQYSNYLFGELTDYLADIRTAVNGKAMSVDGGTHTLTANFIFADGFNIELNNDILVKASGNIFVENNGLIEVQAGGALTIDGGQTVAGTFNGTAASVFTWTNGADVTFDTVVVIDATNGEIQLDGLLTVSGGADIQVANNGQIIIQSGGNMVAEDPEDITINDDSQNFRLCMTPAWIEQVSDAFMWDRVANSTALIQQNVTSGYQMLFTLPLVVGDVLNSVSMMVNGSAGGGSHGGTLPTTRPTIEVFSVDVSGVETPVGTTGVDIAANAAAYDVAHATTISAIGHTVTADAYYIRIKGEHDGGAQAGTTGILSIFGNVTAKFYRGTADILP